MISARVFYMIAALGCLAAAACGGSLRHVAVAQDGAGSNAPPSSPPNDRSTANDLLGRDSVWNDPDIPVLGNPEGDLTIVEYFDNQCPICKQECQDRSEEHTSELQSPYVISY